jgi:hypothetical protein
MTNDGSLNKKAISDLFDSEEKCGITYRHFDSGRISTDKEMEEHDKHEILAYLPGDFGQMGRCTNCADFVAHVMRNSGYDAVRAGFLVDNNPSVSSDSVCVAMGHDFCIVENRYIVDLWISLYTGETTQVVFDLEAPEDFDSIAKNYGDKKSWQFIDPTDFKILKNPFTTSSMSFTY